MIHLGRLLLCAGLGLAAPLGALTVDDLSGIWQGDGDSTWAEMLKDPILAQMPPEQLALVRARTVEVIAQLTCTFSAGIAIVGTTPAESLTEAAVVADGGAAVMDDGALSQARAVRAGVGRVTRRWRSDGTDEATLFGADVDGRPRAHRIERLDRGLMRVTTTKDGDHPLVVIFRAASTRAK